MEITTSGDVKIALIVPRFDAYTAKEVETALRELLEEGTEKLLCDFSQTEYISSAGLRVLLITAKALKRSGGRIALSSLKTHVKEVFDTAGFTPLFNVSDSRQAALEELAADEV